MTEPVESVQPQDDDDAVREAFACPDCTANRGERCRDMHGAEVPTHDSRYERYDREGGGHAA